MEYFIEEERVSKEDFEQRLEEAIREEISNYMDDIIDEIYPPYKIGNGIEYLASTILKELDPITYSLMESDEVNARLEDYLYDFENENEEQINSILFTTKEESNTLED